MMQETVNLLLLHFRGSSFWLTGDPTLNVNANYDLHAGRQDENTEKFGGDNNAVICSEHEHVADGHGAHNDAHCKNLYVEKDGLESLISSFNSASLLLMLMFGRKFIADHLAAILDQYFPVKKMAHEAWYTTDCENLGKSMSQNIFIEVGLRTTRMENNNDNTTIVYSKDPVLVLHNHIKSEQGNHLFRIPHHAVEPIL